MTDENPPIMVEVPWPAETDIEILCAWWCREGSELNRQMYLIKRRVEEFVRDKTVVVTENGRLEAQSAGWEWAEDEIAVELPELVTAMKATISGTQKQIERVLSLAYEEIPTLDPPVIARTIDKRAANKYANAGGEKGERLRGLRVPKPAKVVIA